MKTTIKKQKVTGKVDYVRESTGEIITMDVMETIEGYYNFHKVWLGNFIKCFSGHTDKRLKVIFFILNEMDSANRICMTQKQMAEAVNVSGFTVYKAIKLLRENDFLRAINSGVYMVNPNIIFKGRKNRRMIMLAEYAALKHEEKV